MSNTKLADKVMGCLLGGEIGDAIGAPVENLSFQEITDKYGWIIDFSGNGTDDSALKHLLCDAIELADGFPTADAWAAVWLEQNSFQKMGFWHPVMNSYWRIRGEGIAPRDAGIGNMASSSSAMCISPIGIINAGNPRQAALETYEIAGLIHHNFSRDAACSMAAAVAAAFCPDASVASVLEASTAYLPLRSARVMRYSIQATMELAEQTAVYETFRERYYNEKIIPGSAMPDARETVPVAFALFYLAGGDPGKTIQYGANFGRDADTIASMAGAMAGALHGESALPDKWIEKIRMIGSRDRTALVHLLIEAIHRRTAEQTSVIEAVRSLESNS